MPPTTTEQPNILYLHVHDMGRYCQPYGHAIPTPNIQKLAERGVVFRDAHCAGPTCSPSRAALLTGQSPHSCGMFGLAHRGFRLNDYGKHMVHTLRSAGYHSALCGVQHIASGTYVEGGPEAIGYDEVLSIGPGGDAARATAGAEWIRTQAPKDTPWFLAAGFMDTHRGLGDPGTFEDERYTAVPPSLPDTPEIRRDMAAYHKRARWVDRWYGIVLDALAESGQMDNTIVICTTDHGIAFPKMKCNLTHHGTGVALILAGPEEFGGGRVCDALTSQVDLFPTLCDRMGIDAPDWLEGTSLLPVLRGDSAAVNDEIFSEVTWHAAYDPMRSVRTKRWNYIRRFADRDVPVLPNCDPSASKDYMMANGLPDRPLAKEELYDLTWDPTEACNRADDPACQDILGEMRARLDAWMERTNDPILRGEIEIPPGGQYDPVDGLHAGRDLRTAPGAE